MRSSSSIIFVRSSDSSRRFTIPTAVYASESNFIDGTLVDAAVRERASTAAAQLASVLGQRAVRAPSAAPVRLAAAR